MESPSNPECPGQNNEGAQNTYNYSSVSSTDHFTAKVNRKRQRCWHAPATEVPTLVAQRSIWKSSARSSLRFWSGIPREMLSAALSL